MALNSALIGVLRGRSASFLNCRTIVSKAFLDTTDKPAPYDYLNKPFNIVLAQLDKTTLRLDENSKLICVEGAHAIGKTALAKELAETFGMKYMGPPNMDDMYITPYGEDLRKYQHLYPDFYKCMDEKAFFKDPLSMSHGSADRFLFFNFGLKFINQLQAIRHILNTGQGVVLETCAHADYCYFNAAYNAGWVQPEMREMYYMVMKNCLHEVFRPNLIVYLDAPVDVVQNNIKKRGNEWDKDSKVWNNSQYLSDIYGEFKQNFLRDIQRWSRTLVYDWSDGGDAEVVVEDIEHTELDMIELYDDQQKEWRFHDEQGAAYQRNRFTNLRKIDDKLNTLQVCEMKYNEILVPTTETFCAMQDVMRLLPSNAYRYGFNAHLGDDTTLGTLFGSMHTAYAMDRRFQWPKLFPTVVPTSEERKEILAGKVKLEEMVY